MLFHVSDYIQLYASYFRRCHTILRTFRKELFFSVNRWDLEKLYAERRRVQNILEEKLGAIECESGNAEVQWKNIKEFVLDTISDLVGKVEKRVRKLWITQEMISKMDERRKWKNVNTEEGSRNYRRLRNEVLKSHRKDQKGIS